MQCARAILASVTCAVLQYFPTLSHKRYDIREKKLLKTNVCFDFLYNFCLKISHSNTKRARYDQKCILVFVQSTLYFCPFLMTKFFDRFSKNPQI